MLSSDFWRKYFKVYDVLNLAASYKELLRKVAEDSEIREGDLVLDAGAGTGNLVSLLEKQGAKVVALDFSKEALDVCKRKNPNTEIVLSDITKKLPFEDGYFDKIVSNNTLYNIPRKKRPEVLTELKRVLTPGGRITLSNIHEGFKPIKIYTESISKDIKENGWARALGRSAVMLVPTIMIFYYNFFIQKEYKFSEKNLFEREEQKKLLEEAGFIDVSETKSVYANQGILNSAQKP